MKIKGIIDRHVTVVLSRNGCNHSLFLKFEIDGILKKVKSKPLYYIKIGDGPNASVLFNKDCIKDINFNAVFPKITIDL